MTPPPLFFDPEDVEKLVFYDSILLGGPWGHVQHNMTATLIRDGDFKGELAGQIGMGNEVNLAWPISLPDTTVQSYLDLLLTIELVDEPYRRSLTQTGLYSTRRLEVSTSQKTIVFRNGSEDRIGVTSWEATIDTKVQVSHDKALTDAWQLLNNDLWISERTKALFDAWEEYQKAKRPKRPLR
jgi:hypothetical protein